MGMSDCTQIRCRIGRGFSLVEVTISTLIIGIVLVASLQTVAVSKARQSSVGRAVRGEHLAVQLMAEIRDLPYWDPVVQGGLGPATEETIFGNRSLYDDVDDYRGWSASPPQEPDGTVIPGFDGWRRSVVVMWLKPDRFIQSVTETGIKGVLVTVEDNGKIVSELWAIQANVDMGP